MPRRTVEVEAKEALNLAQEQSENVFLFVPNLIGMRYTRIILAAVSLRYMSFHPIYCTIAYCISCLLDAVDGQAARALDQTSKFGAVLDMVTDRCTTSCLLCYLSSAYPDYAILFQALIALDFSSHYMHMYSSLVTGATSHKNIKSDVSNILWWYYNNSTTLFLVCAGNELFYVALYLMKWTSKPIPWGDSLPACTYPQLLALVSLPVCFAKNVINGVQLWKASKILVGVDIAEHHVFFRGMRRTAIVSLTKRVSPRPLRRPILHRFSSTTPTPEPEAAELPADIPPSTSAVQDASPPLEEPERVKRKTRLTPVSPLPKEPESPLEFPEGLGVQILWQPEAQSEAGPGPSSAPHGLPPPEILEEAQHNLNITLLHSIQHRGTYPSPLGPLVEPSLALYCPIEGGDYVIDATVRELARRINAEVLVLDAVQLAAGEWGMFGKAANALQLPRNPLHFPSPPPAASRSSTSDENDDDGDGQSSPLLTPTQMTLTLLNPQSGRSLVTSAARRTAPPSKISMFFENVVNTLPPDEEVRPRLIYIRDFPTLAPSAAAWYPSLLASVRARRRRPLSRTTAPITHPVTIVFGITPSLVPKASIPTPAPAARRTGSESKGSEWSEDESSDRAREKRLRERLRRWERGEGLHEELSRVSPGAMEGGGDSEPNSGIIIIGPSTAMMPEELASRARGNDSSPDWDSLFFRTSVLVPETRSLDDERATRVKRRREINELTMRMGVGAVGGAIDKESAGTVLEPSEGQKEDSKRRMWQNWGDRIEAWPTVRAVSDRAVGRAVSMSSPLTARSMDPTPVAWEAIDHAWTAHRASRGLRKSWMKEATKSSRDQAEDDELSEDEDAEAEPVDEVVERVRNDEDLDPHERQLLPCIVNSASMPTSFKQVHLPAHTIDSVRTIVSLPLLHPHAFQQGILKEHGMTGCLLFGPPGTGKTLVVRALAKEAGCRMLSITPADVLDMYVGEGEKLVKAVFSLARRLGPCVIFLDEIDALFGARSSGRDRGGGALAHRSVLTEFMQEMDGLRSSREDRVIVIGATNRPFDLDDAVLRRLPRRLLVDLPGEHERAEILNILLRDEALGPDADTHSIAKKTEGFSGSDLKHLCVSAALDAVKESVVVPWSAASPVTTDGAETPSSITEAADSPSKTTPSEADSSAPTATEAPSPSAVPRVLHLRHFTKALKEITPSASEFSGTLAELRNWNQEFGEGRTTTKKRQQVWGRDRFGFTEKTIVPEEAGRVLPSGGNA
ncbi:AAA domain-containing protein [Mycena chlorophos]|uniref:CDP-diacylglycerol--inositol 3-phosphatidyltransferase n=1 Tax=Mycena chlorophos TaxID=658473 RepID=A0A8H6TS07_MYCCL|nr:AAA domain-containing protein [Mycena chlorophos]